MGFQDRGESILTLPEGEVEVAEGKAFRIEIRRDRCKACEICVEFCPKNVFEPDELGRPIPKRVDDCIGCGTCELRCPDFAIEIKSKEWS